MTSPTIDDTVSYRDPGVAVVQQIPARTADNVISLTVLKYIATASQDVLGTVREVHTEGMSLLDAWEDEEGITEVYADPEEVSSL